MRQIRKIGQLVIDLELNLTSLDELGLLNLLGRIFRELRRRGTIRTDSFTAEIGEYWAKNLLDLELAQTGTPGMDATKGDVRYQIKTRRIYPGAKSTKSTRRVPDTHIGEYDYLLLVILDEFFACTEIWQTPISAFKGETGITVKWIQDNPASKKIWPETAG